MRVREPEVFEAGARRWPGSRHEQSCSRWSRSTSQSQSRLAVEGTLCRRVQQPFSQSVQRGGVLGEPGVFGRGLIVVVAGDKKAPGTPERCAGGSLLNRGTHPRRAG